MSHPIGDMIGESIARQGCLHIILSALIGFVLGLTFMWVIG